MDLDAETPTLNVCATHVSTDKGVIEQDDAKTTSSARTLPIPEHLLPLLRRVPATSAKPPATPAPSRSECGPQQGQGGVGRRDPRQSRNRGAGRRRAQRHRADRKLRMRPRPLRLGRAHRERAQAPRSKPLVGGLS